MRYMPGGEERAKLAAEFAPKTLDLFAACWRDHGFGPWAVEEKAGGKLIGHLGLRFLPERDETELLYMLDDLAWGKGFAREGARAALAAADEAGFGELVGFTHPENVRSQNVLAASGFAPTGMVKVFGLNATGFRRPPVQPA
jgi:ribosomal-protein-alanine N-acetyltransferase